MKFRSRLPAETIAKLRTVAKGTDKVKAKACLAQLKRELMPDLLEWGQHFLPHYFTSAPSKMHIDLAKRLQWRHLNRGVKEAVIAPRGGAKTTWVSKLYPLYCICHGLEKYIQLIADATEQSENNLRDIRKELESNVALAKQYPHACGEGPRWQVGAIVTKNGIEVGAFGTGKKIRGRSHGADRPTLQIGDDLENDQQVGSPGQRRKVLGWWQRAAMGAGEPNTNVLLVGTALHPEDVIQKTIIQPGWRSQSYSALIVEPTNQDAWDEWRTMYRDVSVKPETREIECRKLYDSKREIFDEGAVLLWPERESLYYLMCWREINGELAFQSEKKSNPHATAATEFPPEFFADSIWFEAWPDMVCKVMALDPSKGTNEKNDYSAYVIAGLGTDGNIYIDANLERRDAMKVVSDGVELFRKHQPRCLAVEVFMFQQLFQLMFQQEAVRLGMIMPIHPVNQTIEKGVRIRSLTPYLWHGQLKFKKDSPGAKLLVEQLKAFPTGEFDDGCFVAGTVIETINGPRTIETIQAGDMVATRTGYCRVMEAGCTGTKSVITLTAKDGTQLTGTFGHPIFDGMAFTPMQSACNMWICETIQLRNQNLLCSMESTFADTRTRNSGPIECITPRTPGTERMASALCIKKSGRPRMGRFQKAMKSITRTTILSTMSSRTWNSLRRLSTTPCIARKGDAERQHQMHWLSWRRLTTLRRSGTDPKQVLHGIKSMPRKHGIAKVRRLSVNTAEVNSKQNFRQEQSSVRLDVFSETKTGDLHLQLKAVPVLERTIGKRQSVYNLTVEDGHEYFANGVLVHNCDSLQMAIEKLCELVNGSEHADRLPVVRG